MRLRPFSHKTVLTVFFHLCQFYFLFASSYDFDPKLFGVSFQPYVKHAENNTGIPSTTSYTFENVKTMLTLISGKFRNIVVSDSFCIHGQYIRNFTYYYGSYASVYTGEAAAQINREHCRRIITTTYIILMDDLFKKTKTETMVIFEAAEKANQIFPGTVDAVGFGYVTTFHDTQTAYRLLQLYKERASQLGLKLGVYLDCYKLIDQINDTIADAQRQMLSESSFVICSSVIVKLKGGPADGVKIIGRDLLSFRQFVHSINSNAVVFGNTQWSALGVNETTESAGAHSIFWQSVNEWAVSHKFKMYLNDAIDKPYVQRNPSLAHRGWWKLTNNSLIDSLDGYVEKAYVNKSYGARSSQNKTEAITAGDCIKILSAITPNKVLKDGTNVDRIINTVTISVFAVASMAVVVALVLIFLRYRKKQTAFTSANVKDFILGTLNKQDGGSMAIIEKVLGAAYEGDLEIPKERIRIERNMVVGCGQFHVVLKALLVRDEGHAETVALKMAKKDCPATAVKRLLSEIKVLTYLGKHPNIVALVGAYTAEQSQGVVLVATEYCAWGSLEGYLRKKGVAHECNEMKPSKKSVFNDDDNEVEPDLLTATQNIPMVDMARWAYEIACGMEYLEKKHFVHEDLATRNVLLTAEKTAKIGDFGLTRFSNRNNVEKMKEPPAWQWMALESLKAKGCKFSVKSDVWSYGITLWEIFSEGEIPYPGTSWTQSFVNKLVNGLRPDCPPFATPEIYNIMRDCWNYEPNERPNFTELVGFTKGILEKSLKMKSAENGSSRNLYENVVES